MGGIRKRLVAAVAIFAAVAGSASADIRPRIQYYNVDAPTLAGLRDQLNARGPRGHWAYSEWNLRWTGSCRVTASGTITFPHHANPDVLSAADRRVWEDMIAALMAHELNHIEHGNRAAAEIRRANCTRGDAILRKWSQEDADYDRRTRHGALEGVDLR